MTGLGLAAALPFNQTKGDPLLSLGPVFAIRAKDSIPGEQWALNKGTGGQVLRARYGSVGRAEIRRGIGAIFPGTTTNYISVPDAANLRLTQDIDIAVRYTLESLAPATWQSLACRWNGGADRSFQFAISSGGSGLLAFQRTGDGTTVDSLTSTNTLTANGLVIGNTYWFRARTSGTTLTFEWAPDSEEKPTSWTAFGGTRPLAASSFWAGTAPFWVGVNTSVTNDPLSGVVKRVVYGSYNGSTVLDIDFTQQNDLTTSFTCTTGQTVTVTAVNAVDTNDPTLLKASGKNYIYFPGGTGNYYQVGHTAVLASLTTLEYRVKVRLDSIGTSHWLGGSDSTHFGFQINSSNQLNIYALNTPGFTRIGDASSSAIPGISAGVDVWLRGRVTISTAQCDYWYSYDTTDVVGDVSWTYISGSVGINAGTTPALTSSAVSTFGTYSTSLTGMSGQMYVGSLLCSGSVRAHVDFTKATPTVVDGNNLNGVTTVGRATSGKKTAVVNQSCWLLGTDDYLEVADNDLLDFNNTQKFGIVVVTRQYGATTGMPYIGKADANSAGVVGPRWIMRMSTNSNIFILDDGVSVSSRSYTDQDGTLEVATVSVDLTYVTMYRNNVPTSGTPRPSGTSANSLAMRIGSYISGSYLDAEIYAVYIFRQALTAAQIAAGVQYWNAA